MRSSIGCLRRDSSLDKNLSPTQIGKVRPLCAENSGTACGMSGTSQAKHELTPSFAQSYSESLREQAGGQANGHQLLRSRERCVFGRARTPVRAARARKRRAGDCAPYLTRTAASLGGSTAGKG